MFGYSSLELIGMSLSMLIPASSHRISETLEEELIEADGISRVPGEVVSDIYYRGVSCSGSPTISPSRKLL